ncbi:hypothetical protein REC12_17290 [Desulfosporosinus sp. PR]|uniref:hypothetical protein n=1 Tax=Candidatus Desulfosporosinus nitrosoreducens TaxID=3401928 RepID=UPI0027FA1AE9|nr:hypothetical protein [Desulfosporosinus sp. PR]MDQ7095348.1 hypothetical protein [Desulfosporosinus sp. PR]
MKLLKQVIKNHYFDLIEFYGIILIMVVPFMIWLLPKWSMGGRMLYLGVLQISIFMGLLTRFTGDLTIFNTNVQYCLAPIKQGGKILAPVAFFVVNYLIADALVLFFLNITHAFSLGPVITGFTQIFLLACYILIIVILGTLLSLTLFPKPHLDIPALARYKINAQQIYSSTGGALNAVICIATLLFSQAISKILFTPFFTVTIKASDYVATSTREISVNTLPYLLLGLVYVSLIFFLSGKKVYSE